MLRGTATSASRSASHSEWAEVQGDPAAVHEAIEGLMRRREALFACVKKVSGHNRKTWAACEAHCTSLGERMPCITNEHENAALLVHTRG